MNDWAAIIAGTAAGLAGLTYLVGKARKLFRVLDAIQVVVERELEHNGGSSMKDNLHGVAVSVGKLQRRVDELEGKFIRHIAGRPQ